MSSMSRVRASSQGPRRPVAVSQPLSLEQMRERMLTRRNVDLRLNPQEVQQPAERPPTSGVAQPLFVGRSLVISNSPSHPCGGPSEDAADPHRLFQMLRRKKRAAAGAPDRAGAAPGGAPPSGATTRNSPDRAVPHPGLDASNEAPLHGVSAASPPPPPPDVPPRPQGAGRPLGAMRNAFSAGSAPSAVPAQHSARPPRDGSSSAGPHHQPSPGAAPDGRPVTRQKLPTQALDLFGPGPVTTTLGSTVGGGSSSSAAAADPFPKPAGGGAGSRKGSAARAQMPQPGAGVLGADGKKPPVDFRCLFVRGEGDLGMPDEFPSPNAGRVDIPLIETEWFSPTDTWEALPGGADEVAPGGRNGDSFEVDDASQSLYDLLVATKGRRSASNRKS